jgi:signal transduction histidine kinase
MAGPADGRSPVRPALALIGGLAVTVVVAEIGMAAQVETAGSDGAVWGSVLSAAVGAVYLLAGALAWARRPSNGMGRILVVGGFVLFAGNLVNTSDPMLIAIGMVVSSVPLGVAVHLLLAFPSGRLSATLPRAVVGVGYGVCLVLQAPLYLFVLEPPPYHLLGVADRPDVARLGSLVQTTVGGAVLLVTAVLLVGRLRRATPAQRRVLVPLYAYGVLVVPVIPALANLGGALPPDVGVAVQLVLLAGVPVAFALAVLRGGFARTGEIEELGVWLGTSGDARPELASALARTLGDRSLRLLFWVAERGEYVDTQGRPEALPAAGSGRAAVEVDLAGRRVGVIVYDASLIADPHDVRLAGRVVALAVDRERLTAELRASTEALTDSRARIVEAADRERRRLGRNLHDGLQVRLVLLAMEAQLLAKSTEAPSTREAATALRVGIDAAAGELRDLVHAVMPAPLVERGLSAATEDLVDRVPLPVNVQLDVVDGALAPALESTAYFVVAEALANALKHSAATALTVRVVAANGWLTVEVCDDGAGGALAGNGTGLRGLADRVDTLGGRLTVDSPRGAGTRVLAELPCG